MLEICSDLSKTGLKIYYFLSTFKKGQKMAKWPNGQTILFLVNSFKKAKFGRFDTPHTLMQPYQTSHAMMI
jgi:hypothetical protein